MNGYTYFSPSGDGWRNLAQDEYFLDHLTGEDFLLYFYVNQRAVIIGRNQNPWRECDTARMDAEGVQLVRRCTGGGAVYHDGGNLNFSFICGADYYDVERQTDIILDALKSLGIPAEKNGRNDLTADGRKFSGHAFCSRGGMRQHHGTLLISSELGVMQNYLTVSPEKLKSKGVTSVRSRVLNLSELRPDLTNDMAAAAVIRACEDRMGPLAPLTLTEADRTEIEKYYQKQSSWEWRMGASPAFDFQAGKKFPWGEVQLYMDVRGGVITRVKLYTDALDAELAGRAESVLTGCRYDSAPAVLLACGGEMRDLKELL